MAEKRSSTSGQKNTADPIVPPFPTTPGYQYPPVVSVGDEVASSTDAPSAGSEDDEIRVSVIDSINARPDIPEDSDISVEVQSGVVTLRGTVPSDYVRQAVADAAASAPSVSTVNNEMRVG
jgi:osmotically-inducible protein OsmY